MLAGPSMMSSSTSLSSAFTRVADEHLVLAVHIDRAYIAILYRSARVYSTGPVVPLGECVTHPSYPWLGFSLRL